MTQRDLAFKWSLYGVGSLGLLLLQQFVLIRIDFLDVHPFVLPLLAITAATLENPQQAAAYSLILGACCDLFFSPVFPFFYTLVFFLSAVICALIAGHLIAAKFSCCLLNGALSLLLAGFLQALPQLYNNTATLLTAGNLILREILVSLPLLPLIYLLFLQIHRKTSWD